MRAIDATRSYSIGLRTAIAAMLALAASSLILSSSAYAATLTVCTTGSPCYATIAAAVAAASTGDTIFVNENSDNESSTVDIGTGPTGLTLTIEGLGVSNTTVNGSGTGPVFTIESGSTVTIEDMTVSNGYGASNGGGISNSGTLNILHAAVSGNISGANGGGIANLSGASLTIDNSTISGNYAYFGAGILNSYGTVTITDSTFSNNQASGNGGALYNLSSATGPVSILNSTFSGNTAVTYGGAIDNFSGPVTISFSTIANNSASGTSGSPGGGIYGAATVDNSIIGQNTDGNCSETVTALGSNLETDASCGSTNFTQVTTSALNLGPLTLNAPGATATLALNSPSAAIDQIAPANCTDANNSPVAYDQRGVSRPQGPACDIGSFEFIPPPISTTINFYPSDNPTGPNVTMGAFIRDDATVTLSNGTIPSNSSVTFNLFSTASCTGSPLSSDPNVQFPGPGGASSESVESSGDPTMSALGPLSVGQLAYQAVFNNGAESATGACEPLNVQSPINQISYTVGSDPTQYTCAVASLGDPCPAGQPEATVTAGTLTTFVVDVEVTNLTGIDGISEYVEGTLPKGNNFSYANVSTDCGGAVVKGNGDVLWNAGGSHSPNASGFTMSMGQVCHLEVTIAATFTSPPPSQQAISGPWYATQTEPGVGQPITSPLTGSLAVDVTP